MKDVSIIVLKIDLVILYALPDGVLGYLGDVTETYVRTFNNKLNVRPLYSLEFSIIFMDHRG